MAGTSSYVPTSVCIAVANRGEAVRALITDTVVITTFSRLPGGREIVIAPLIAVIWRLWAVSTEALNITISIESTTPPLAATGARPPA